MKKALLIGINYLNYPKYQLNGCINDVNKFNNFLINKVKYESKNIKILTDKTVMKPTKKNILLELNNILIDINENKIKEVILLYSGHGTQIYDKNKEEKDNLDEMIITCDLNTIKDDEFNSFFLNKITNDSVKIICIFDCCHSGTILDLNYCYTNGKKRINKNKNIRGNICCISGCLDNEKSVETYINNKISGVMTNYLLKSLETYNYDITFTALVKCINNELKKNNFQQNCQLSSNLEILEDYKFIGKDKDKLEIIETKINENNLERTTIKQKIKMFQINKEKIKIKLNNLEKKKKEIIINYRKKYFYFKKTRSRYYYYELIKQIQLYKNNIQEIKKENKNLKIINLNIKKLEIELNNFNIKNKNLKLKSFKYHLII